MRLTIVLRKEVPDEQTAQALRQVNQSLLLTPPTP